MHKKCRHINDLFCIIGIIFDIAFEGNFTLENYQFTKMVMGCLFIGMGFGIPSVIYQNEKMPKPIQILIHMGIGCIIYTITAILVGWLPTEAGFGKYLLIISSQILLAFWIIWFGFVLYYKKEAKKINNRIQTMK